MLLEKELLGNGSLQTSHVIRRQATQMNLFTSSLDPGKKIDANAFGVFPHLPFALQCTLRHTLHVVQAGAVQRGFEHSRHLVF